MTMTLLLVSALKSALLGAIVWSVIKVFRFRDSATETVIWVGVLVACLLMPLMVQAVPTAIRLPALWANVPAAEAPVLGVAFLSKGHFVDPAQSPVWQGTVWLKLHWVPLLGICYAVITLAGLARLLVGLVLTARLYRESVLVDAPWAKGRRVRLNGRTRAPVSCGSCIILPNDYGDWPAKKLAAVLAHEQAHLDRGDFFIQLLATLHRTLFWFSPFAWWLQARLAFLAEAASDEAAVRLLNDRTFYAEVLLEMSQKAQGAPFLVGMSSRGNMYPRIMQILDDSLTIDPPANRTRFLLVMAILPLAGILAGARANNSLAIPVAVSGVKSAVSLLQSKSAEIPRMQVSTKTVIGQIDKQFKPVRRRGATQTPDELESQAATTASTPSVLSSAASSDVGEVTYNPRALLENPGTAVVSAIIPVVPDGHQSVNRSAPALLDLRSKDHDTQ